MFFQVFKKELAGDLYNEDIIFNGDRLNRFEPGLVILPLDNILDDLQKI